MPPIPNRPLHPILPHYLYPRLPNSIYAPPASDPSSPHPSSVPTTSLPRLVSLLLPPQRLFCLLFSIKPRRVAAGYLPTLSTSSLLPRPTVPPLPCSLLPLPLLRYSRSGDGQSVPGKQLTRELGRHRHSYRLDSKQRGEARRGAKRGQASFPLRQHSLTPLTLEGRMRPSVSPPSCTSSPRASPTRPSPTPPSTSPCSSPLGALRYGVVASSRFGEKPRVVNLPVGTAIEGKTGNLPKVTARVIEHKYKNMVSSSPPPPFRTLLKLVQASRWTRFERSTLTTRRR